MAQFEDNFTGPGTGDIDLDTHSPDTGTSWVVQLGNVGGLDDSADAAMRDQVGGTQTEPGWIASDDLSDADMQAWVQRNGTVNDSNWIVAVRISDDGTDITCYGIRSYGNGGAGARLVEVDAGSITDLDTADGGTSDDWYRVVADGTDLYAYAAGSSTEPASPEEDTNWGTAAMSADITGGLNPTVTRHGLAAYTSAGGGNEGVWAAYRADTYPAAGGGPPGASVPIFHHHYQQMRGA